ncbi:RHS repeat domain-containing protein [Pseudomonas maumuensis]|uniref:Sugar-binding protein n=1 Tax=Pseudomonas maumuensis TaxID=2842354 RepID=A0ABX8NG52_9PSED|nr:sugar-binding protein [Pseudomonas maumuensis]QXH55340.1 sugar-binding protein [Pseudomonas maumuensis]
MSAETALHSKAFNFMSYLQGGVDPRTGQYTFSIALRETQANFLQGPGLPLTLFFNPLNRNDSGYGRGWNLQLSQYDTDSKIVNVHSGESFAVTGPVSGQPGLGMSEKKIDNFHLEEAGADTFRLAHRSGLVEILTLQRGTTLAMPTKVYSDKGHGITLAYEVVAGAPRLTSIRDERRKIFSFERKAASVPGRPEVKEIISLVLNPDASGSSRVEYQMELDQNQRVTSVRLPTANDAEQKVYPYWRLSYTQIDGYHCIDKVRTPLGARETLSYSAPGKGHVIPKSTATLPRVVKHEIDPRSGQPKIVTSYDYGLSSDAGGGYKIGNNFLGAGLDLNNPDTRLDYLYRYTAAYLYGSIETQVSGSITRTVERRFNRFHLLELERTRQQQQEDGRTVSYTHDTTTTYKISNGYFEQQAAYCQLPEDTLNHWVKSPGSEREETTTRRRYHNDGNLKEETQATGVRVAYEWYSADGEGSDCPKDAEGFNRHLKSTTTHPDPQAKYGKALATYQHHRYEQGEPLDTADSKHVKKWHRVKNDNLYEGTNNRGTLLQAGDYLYHDEPADGLLHGRVKEETLTLNGLATTTTYAYGVETKGTFLAEPVLVTTQTVTGHDHQENGKAEDSRRKSITQESSQFTGEQVLAVDDNEVRIRSEHNELGQVIAEIVAPDDQDGYEARRVYSYTLCPNEGSWTDPVDEQALQTRKDVNGVTTTTYVDGLGRAVAEWREDWDNNGGQKPGQPRQLYSARYDAFGQLLDETEYDWQSKQDALALKTAYEHDGWGQQVVTVGPDGVRVVEQNDPIGPGVQVHDGRVAKRWREWTGSGPMKTGVSETRMNKADAPVWAERRGLDEKRLSLQETLYDGLARVAQQATGEGVKARVTAFAYDPFDRATHETRPKAISYSDDRKALTTSVVQRQYALHSREDLQVAIGVAEFDEGRRTREPHVLGTRKIDGLGRLEHEDIGGRERSPTYKPGERQPDKVITEEGQIEYTYELRLSEKPMTRGLGAQVRQSDVVYDYDKINARLNGWEMPAQGGQPRQTLEREYYQTGQIKRETFIRHESPSPVIHSMAYVYSHRGRLLEYTDVLGQVQVNGYDAHGRLASTTMHAPGQKEGEKGEVLLETTFHYDSLGRMYLHKTLDKKTGQKLDTQLKFDEFDRETHRTFIAEGFAQTLVQTYDDADAMLSRALTEGSDGQGKEIRMETYEYDLRQRLVEYRCTGTQRPQDPYGNAMTGQSFKFDGLDNIREVVTTFDGGSNTATYHFENEDPVQLSRITNTHTTGTGKYPAEIKLAYDRNGNLISDEEQRVLEYDHLNRLLSVKGADVEVQYHYDPLDILIGTEQGAVKQQRFYRGNELVNQTGTDGDISFVKGGEQIIAELTNESAVKA